jgi:hypothetical protein
MKKRNLCISKISQIFGINRHSYYLLSAFLLVCLLIAYIWWPLVQEYFGYFDSRYAWYYYVDWLLLGLFLFMSITILARADLKRDGLIVFVGICGGLVIESWGTQTNIWHYYTAERPPLWIIPAWPIASLSIDRITRLFNVLTRQAAGRFIESPAFVKLVNSLFWLIFGGFYVLMLWFVAPTLDKSFTWIALAICAGVVITAKDRRMALLVFLAGSSLGYFLELWGTTRECWTYYTGQTPPVFAVFAHGMAAVAFWKAGLVLKNLQEMIRVRLPVSGL